MRAKRNKVPKYRVDIIWSDEDGCYVARVPELEGCVTDGKTYEEAARNAEEAIASHLGALEKEGLPFPIPFSERQFSGKILLRMDPRLHRDLAIKADIEEKSLNKYIEDALARVR